jgi:hypothetical protein
LGRRLWEIGTREFGEWRRLFSKVTKLELTIHEKGYGSLDQRHTRGVHRKEENIFEPLDISAWTNSCWIPNKVYKENSKVIKTIHDQS